MRNSQRKFVSVLGLGLLALALLATGTVTAAGKGAPVSEPGVVETFGMVFAGGKDPALSQAEMADTYAWLWSERAVTPLEPGIAIELTQQDRIDIGQEPCEGCDGRLLVNPGKKRVGVVKPLARSVDFEGFSPRALKGKRLFGRGGTRQFDDGAVWTLSTESNDARGLRIHFAGVNLPDGAELYVYNDLGEAYGPYTGRGLHDDGEFWSHSVGGSSAYVQLRYFGDLDVPSLAKVRFRIDRVAYLGADSVHPIATDPADPVTADTFCNFNVPCIENASCPAGMPSAVAQARDGIAHMQWISGPFIYICTGGLLEDTPQSGRPLFLTANHCLSRGKDAKNLETFWQFEVGCSGNCPDPFQDPQGVEKLVGATILSTSSSSDYTLMELKQTPPSGSFFIGWTNEAVADDNGLELHRISHPSGAPQAYSSQDVDTSAGTCQGIPRGDWIYSRDTYGGTEGGSSGSPVMNALGQVVGQLTGACGTNTGDSCDSVRNATIDGALAAYYPNIATYLAPDGGGSGGVCNNDGICAGDEDCTNCSDCDGRTGGRRSNRYCCGDGIRQSAETGTITCDGNY